MSFEWQTEDERNWEQPEGGADGNSSRSLRRWAWLALFVSLIAAGAYLGWQQVQERVEAGAETVREEVRASYALAERAALDRDQELFVSLLSGRSATWTDAQRERAEQGLLFGDTGRVLAFERAGPAEGDAHVELNADLTEAAVSVAQPFIVDAGSGLTETVVLTQTHVFRRGSQRWLLSPPDDDYWGEWRTRNGPALQMVYPLRDEEVALRLHDDLQRKLIEMCRTLVDCPPEFSMMLRFETDVQSILTVASGEEKLSGGREAVLPTPSLIGLPVDETAYAALFRGYARHIVSVAMVELLDYSCCRMANFQEAMLDWQLSRLSLRSAPLRQEQYLELVELPLEIDDLIQLANAYEPRASDSEAELEAHAFIDSLRSRLSLRQDPLTDMHAVLSGISSFWGWVEFLTDYEPSNPAVLRDDWTAFVWDKALQAQSVAQPIPAALQPSQDIVAMCGNQNLDIYRYSVASGEWSKEVAAGVNFAALNALPGGNGYMMTGQLPDQEFDTGLVTYLRRGSDEPFALVQNEPQNTAILPWGVQDPLGERMVVWVFSVGNEADGRAHGALIDPSTCTAQGCDLQLLPGMPLWSPAGRLALAIDPSDSSLLYLPPGATSWKTLEARPVMFPFWIDERRFGFVEIGEFSDRHTIEAVDLASGETAELISSEELGEALEIEGRRDALSISFVLSNPLQENSILIGAAGRVSPSKSYLFSLALGEDDPLTGANPRLALLNSFDGYLSYGTFAPNYQQQGDRFVDALLDEGDGSQILLYDIQGNEVVLKSSAGMPSGFFAGSGLWSSDGRWFAHAIEKAVHLFSPAEREGGEPLRQLLFHDFERCESPVWVNPQ